MSPPQVMYGVWMLVADGVGPTAPAPTRSRNLFSCAWPQSTKVRASPHPETTVKDFRRVFFITVLRSDRRTPRVRTSKRPERTSPAADTCAGSRAGRLQFPLMSVGLRHLPGKYKMTAG